MPDRTRPIRKEICLNEQELNLVQHKMRQLGTHNFGAYARKMLIECCSGDLADLKVKSVDVEAWSPRQQKYFEVGSCSNLGDAQARRLGIRIKNKEKGNYFAHTLNNTVVAPPRTLIAFLENNLKADGTIAIPEPLRMYMGGKSVIE